VAITALRSSPSDQTLQQARDAWRAARQPWERGESFLFGPASSMGFDPGLDTWPLGQDDLEDLLSGDTPLNAETLNSLEPDVKGYHAIELILFGQGGTKQASELTSRELTYAALVAGEMEGIAVTLNLAWTQGVDGQPAFRTVLTSAGAGN